MTRLLSLGGAGLPIDLVPAASDNPRGFWEPNEAVRLNDRFLASKNSSWYDPSLLHVRAEREEAYTAEVTSLLQRCWGDDPVLVLKEPRIYGVFEVWLKAAAQAGFETKIVHIFRNPDEVVGSLQARDNLATEHSQALWLKYNLEIEKSTRHLPKVIVDYAGVMADPEATLQRCIGTLDVALSLSESAREGLKAFIDSTLHHQRAPCHDKVSDPTPDRWIERIFAALQTAAQAGPIDTAEFDDIYDRFERTQVFFRALAFSYRTWEHLLAPLNQP